LTLPPALGHNGITAKQTLDQNGFFSTSGPASCNGTAVGSSYLYDVKVIASNSSNATLEVLATWTADPGYGTPYEMTYERHCAGGAAGAGQTISGTETFTPIPGIPSPGVSLPTCQSVYPGSHEVDLELGGDRQGITNPSPAVGVDIGGFTPEQQADYPLCAAGTLAGTCWLDLQRDGKSCFGPNVYCAGWLQNVVRWNMTCEWGPYLMEIDFCEAKYGTQFDTQPKPNPNPTPTPTPNPNPPTTGPNPESPPTDPDVATDPNSRSCYGDAWSWNPVDWVVVPVKCVLIWAFVPTSPPTFTDLDNPVPAGWFPEVPSVGDTSCGPITLGSLDFGPVGGSTGVTTLVNTCVQPWPQVRAMTYYGLLTLGLLGAGWRALGLITNGLGVGVNVAGGVDRLESMKEKN
jgi:hypothetical protein